ncbi:DJ-1/PfpI family protein [Actinomycetospora corticicola]|uniref:Transcriptional regulator GlxA family with amidase domain n=1 Tax=Actinomycetospora corticicola TaxID=663602 RepID=A0A7Y9DX52_9PSEU|nr:DJ-1/PfpI family protein [Actinomycetospora corticicola]NYD37129.1 transcriptional regulator GlxA family with amidase domain [Actinomycetospora corticicola]
MHIEIVVFDGFDDLDAFGPHEVFSHAARRLDRWSSTLVGVDGPGTVTSAHGVVVTVAQALGEPDLVVVPGGGWHGRGAGARAQADQGVLPRRLAARAARGGLVASVCTGGMILAAAGLTTGRPAVTHHSALEDLAASGALVRPEARVVDDGDLVTSGGVTSGLDLALHLLAREAGPDVARMIAEHVEYTPRVALDGLARR